MHLRIAHCIIVLCFFFVHLFQTKNRFRNRQAKKIYIHCVVILKQIFVFPLFLTSHRHDTDSAKMTHFFRNFSFTRKQYLFYRWKTCVCARVRHTNLNLYSRPAVGCVCKILDKQTLVLVFVEFLNSSIIKTDFPSAFLFPSCFAFILFGVEWGSVSVEEGSCWSGL